MNQPPRSLRLPPRPDLAWGEDGAPRSRESDDVYYSVADGLAETREVFLKGCGLPERWAGRERFCVAELGFGTGLNMLALLELWIRTRPSPTARLDATSVEGRLMTRQDAASALAAWPELAPLAGRLLAQWPHRARGVQTLDLGDGVTLTLFQDEALKALEMSSYQADAWFLDGFSPARNPDMWSDAALEQVARLSAPGCVIGTYTVAGHVRRGLRAVGFDVAKAPGYGRKRERLEAVFSSMNSTPKTDPMLISRAPAKSLRKVVVVGAGIMGACLARAFAEAGSEVTVISGDPGPDAGTSANPLALIMPRLDAADTPASRAFIDAYLCARSFYEPFVDAVASADIAQPSANERDRARHDAILSDAPLDTDLLDASDLGGLLHRNGLVASPLALRRGLLGSADVRWNEQAASVKAGAEPVLRLGDGSGLSADLIVLAPGMGLAALAGRDAPELAGRAGQVEWLEDRASSPAARASGAYAATAFGLTTFGATFTPWDEASSPPESEDARRENLAGLAALWPELAARIERGELRSRTGVRATTPDRLPFAGRLPHSARYAEIWGEALRTGRRLPPTELDAVSRPGVLVAGGLGARGFLWAPLLSRICVALATGAPYPTGAASMEALSPARFLMRRLKRGV